MFHSTPKSSKTKRRRDDDEEKECQNLACAIVDDDQGVFLVVFSEFVSGSNMFLL